MLIRDWSGHDRPPLKRTETLHIVLVTIGWNATVLPYAVIDFPSVGQLHRMRPMSGVLGLFFCPSTGGRWNPREMMDRLMRHDG